MNQKVLAVIRALMVGTMIAAGISLVFLAGWFEPLELKALDMRFKLNAPGRVPSENIVIITIDQNSIDYLKNRVGILWKWPRDVYAYALSYLKLAEARAVLLDFDFSDPDINRAEFEEGETDALLADAVDMAGNVINSFTLYRKARTGDYVEDVADYALLQTFAVNPEGIVHLELPDNESAITPIPALMISSRKLGAATIFTDPDGIIRKNSLFFKLKGDIYISTALAMAQVVTGNDTLAVSLEHTLTIAEKSIPLTEKGEMYINWYGPGGPESGTYRYYPIADILLSYMQMQEGIDPVLQPDEFQGKTVLIGSNAPSLYDLKPTPFSGHGAYPGIEIVATALNNLLDGSPLQRQSDAIAIVLIVLTCLFVALVGGALRSVTQNVIITLAVAAGFYLYSSWAFGNFIFVNIVPVETGVLLTFTGVTVLNYLTEGKEKRWLKKAFSQYLSSSVMDELTKHPEKLKLGGERKEVTILFSDIRGFTSISEKLNPEKLTNILNEYLTPMSDVVLRRSGTLDKYIGDAVMAFFGAPLELENHAVSACEASLDMLSELKKLKERWASQKQPDFVQNMNIGVGLNSGPVSVGNMGSVSRFDYTVLGDNVNLSSRLEGSTKLYGVNAIVSENTYNMAKEQFVFRELDRITVVGKKVPITIYELVCRRDGSSGSIRAEASAKRFEDGINLYRERKWDEALSIFESFHAEHPEDKASALYIQRCIDFKASPPPPEWDGVFERSSK